MKVIASMAWKKKLETEQRTAIFIIKMFDFLN